MLRYCLQQPHGTTITRRRGVEQSSAEAFEWRYEPLNAS